MIVRDYVLYGQARIRDRRTGDTTPDIEGFLGGRIDRFLAGLIRYRAGKRRNPENTKEGTER